MNKAMIAKLVWKFLEDEDCLWGKIMKAKYVKTGNFWEVKKPISCSATWTAMLTVREDMRDRCCWSVVTGEKINVWSDPQIPGLPQIKPERRADEEYIKTTVEELIIQEDHRWDEYKLRKLFNPSEVAKIMEIHLSEVTGEDCKDKLIWTPHPKGEFSSKSFLKTMNDIGPSTSDNYEFPWKKFWSTKNIPPKIQIFMWRLLKNGLLVSKNIKRHIHGINDDCRFCDLHAETNGTCSYTVKQLRLFCLLLLSA